jgi:DUF4097 and DUF4098 domain-containing protein YvlB
MKAIISIIAVFFMFSLTASADYVEERTLEIPAGKIKMFEIDCGAGYLEILGVEGIDKIEVAAEIIIEDVSQKKAEKFINKYMKLELKDKGKYARLISTFDYNGGFRIFSGWSNLNALINLTIKVPKNIELEIDDGSGYIEIKNINGDVELDDGSGDLFLEDIVGRVVIDDGSGEIVMKNIEGHIDLDDGSGEINVDVVKGDLIIDDGSGEISVTEIVGDVDIDDGSGNIRVDGVDGYVVIGDGSGNIRVRDVTKDVEIRDDSSGRVSIANVDGEVYGDY